MKKLSEVKEESTKEKFIQKKNINDFSIKEEKKDKKSFLDFLKTKKTQKTKKDEKVPEKTETEDKDDELEKSFQEIMELYPKELDKLNTSKDEE